MKAGWILQAYYLDNEPEGHLITKALDTLKVPYMIVRWETSSFNDFIWDKETVDIVGAIGSISFIKKFHKNYKGPELYPFFDNQLHYYSRYQHQIPKDKQLNEPGYLLPFDEIKRQNPKKIFGGNESLFFRPDNALKICEAELVSINDFDRWLHYTSNNTGVGGNSFIWIFNPKEINAEYRIVISEGRAVSYSQYMKSNSIFIDNQENKEIVSFAEDCVKFIDIVDSIYIIDLAETPSGIKLVELNAFSTSGMYAGNKLSIMDQATKQLEKVSDEWSI